MLSHFGRVWLFPIPWIVVHQAPLSMGFFRQEECPWLGLPCPPAGDLLDPGIKPGSPALLADSLLSELPGKPYVGHEPIMPHCIFYGVDQSFPFQGSSKGIFPTQGLNPGLLSLLHWPVCSLPLAPSWKPLYTHYLIEILQQPYAYPHFQRRKWRLRKVEGTLGPHDQCKGEPEFVSRKIWTPKIAFFMPGLGSGGNRRHGEEWKRDTSF